MSPPGLKGAINEGDEGRGIPQKARERLAVGHGGRDPQQLFRCRVERGDPQFAVDHDQPILQAPQEVLVIGLHVGEGLLEFFDYLLFSQWPSPLILSGTPEAIIT
jgi:hypothetical protein